MWAIMLIITLETAIAIQIPVAPRLVKYLKKNNKGILITQSLKTSINIEYFELPEP